MKQFVAIVALSLTACTGPAQVRLMTVQTLHGTFVRATCPLVIPSPIDYQAIHLEKPIKVESLGYVDQVELVLYEHDLIQFYNHIGEPGVVSCILRASQLCGSVRAMCAPPNVWVEP